jgi:hypothetical protein
VRVQLGKADFTLAIKNSLTIASSGVLIAITVPVNGKLSLVRNGRAKLGVR